MLSPTRTRTLSRRTAVCIGSGGLAAMLTTYGLHTVQGAEATTLEANKAIIRRVFSEPLYAGNVESVRAFYAKDFLDRGVWAREMAGLADMPITIVAFRESHPELTLTIDPVLAEADLVAAVATWGDSHPPAGMHVVGKTMHLFRLANGQITEEWSAGWEWLAQRGYRSVPQPTNPLAMP